MKIENGKMIFEVIPCDHCDQTGITKKYTSCPNDRKPMYGKVCSFCGSTTKHGHHSKDMGETQNCWKCNGKKEYKEKSTDYMPEGMFESLDFLVVRTDVPH